jgi:4-hydroxy-2-oxoheptanedioate aldolase
MRQSRILKKIRNDQVAMATVLHLTDPSLFEMVSLMGFDGIWMDMEHHYSSLETAAGNMRAARVGPGADIVARPAKGEFMRMSRMLEAGATGIMYPRCDDAEEAKEVVKWAKFAPQGRRGADLGNADAPYCMIPLADYVKMANEETFVLIQVEEPNAVEQAEAILSVPGVDMMLLGPGDFGVLTGIPGQYNHPSVMKAIEKVAKAAKNTGKNWAAIAFTPEYGKQMTEMGARLLFHGSDLTCYKAALERIRADFAKAVGIEFADSGLGAGGSYLQK